MDAGDVVSAGSFGLPQQLFNSAQRDDESSHELFVMCGDFYVCDCCPSILAKKKWGANVSVVPSFHRFEHKTAWAIWMFYNCRKRTMSWPSFSRVFLDWFCRGNPSNGLIRLQHVHRWRMYHDLHQAHVSQSTILWFQAGRFKSSILTTQVLQ